MRQVVLYNVMKKFAEMLTNALRKEEQKEMSRLDRGPGRIFSHIMSIKKDGKDVVGGGYIKGRNGKLDFSEKDRRKVWKEHMDAIINEENVWYQRVEDEMVMGPVQGEPDRRSWGNEENEKGKAAGPSEVSWEMITTIEEIGICVLRMICQDVLDGRGMPDDWEISVDIPVFKVKEDAMP